LTELSSRFNNRKKSRYFRDHDSWKLNVGGNVSASSEWIPMTADDRLARVRAKVERAKQHIVDLNLRLKAFLDSKPYVVGTQRNPETRQLIYFLTGVRNLPPSIGLVVGDVIQNLRSALDHLAFQLYMLGPGGQAGGVGSRTYFPIADDVAKYKIEAPRKVKGLRPDAIKAIDAIEPYKGGSTDKSDTLWRLEKMNNIDKHRILIAIGSQFRSVDVGGLAHRMFQEAMAASPPEMRFTIPKFSVFVKPADRLWPLKAGDQLFIDAPDAKVDENRQFRFDVAFGEAQIAAGEPIIETLQQMADLVDSLIVSFRPFLS